MRMCRRRAILVALVLGVSALALPAHAEDLTFTTYYPAPPAGSGGGGTQKPQRLAVFDPAATAYDAAIGTAANGTALFQGPVGIGTTNLVAGTALAVGGGTVSVNATTTSPNVEGLGVRLTATGSSTGNPVAGNFYAGGANTSTSAAEYRGVTGYAQGSGPQVTNYGVFGHAWGNAPTAIGGSFTAYGDTIPTGASLTGAKTWAIALNNATNPISTVLGAALSAQHGSLQPVTTLGGLFVSAMKTGSGALTTMYGINVTRDVTAGTAPDSRGVWIGNAGASAGGVVTNNYGLYIDNQTSGTTNYALYSAGGQSYFAGKVGLGTTAPVYPLHVEASPTAVGTPPAAGVIYGRNTNTTGARMHGVWGVATSSGANSAGVYGASAATGGNPIGVLGEVLDPAGLGVYGYHNSTTTNGQGAGVYGKSEATTGFVGGVWGVSKSDMGAGVYGYNSAANTDVTKFPAGVWGTSDALRGAGVYGFNSAVSTTTGFAAGVWGQNQSPKGAGVYGYNSNGGTGVAGDGRVANFDAVGPGVNYAATSSIRWKHNITPIDHPLEKLLTLRGIYFDWDEAHGGRHDYGMIAEEVGAVFPEGVVFEPGGTYATSMDYGKLTAVLVEAVKAQQRQLDQLKTENQALRKRLDRLEVR